MSTPGFWDNSENSSKVVKELKNLKAAVEPWQQASLKYQELQELVYVLKQQDTELIEELGCNIGLLVTDVEKLEFVTLLDGEFDKNNAIISINAGAGGTESCDWVSMLFRMYSRWAEIHKYNFKTIDVLVGEEAGIKNID